MKHRTAVVSALSVAGVALAGATALGANLGILRSSSNFGELTAVADPSTSTPTTLASDTETVGYQVLGVGVVTLSRSGEFLTVDSVEAGDWVYRIDHQLDRVEITFLLANRLVEFEARVEEGITLVSVAEQDTVFDAPGATAAPGGPSEEGISFIPDDRGDAGYDEGDDDQHESHPAGEGEHLDDD